MRTNKTLRIASVLLIAVLMTACVIGGTLAKYTTTISTPEESARVAKWNITYNDQDASQVSNITFNLFDTTYDETVASSNSDKVIAPGTAGEFEFSLKNLSEVDAEYTIALTVTNDGNIPIEFSVDGGSTWASDLSAANVATATALDATGETVSIMWQWVYEAGTSTVYGSNTDAADTTLGLAGTAEVTVSAEIVINQVD
ncbi:MAG: hypothetical protein E7667_00230 [Ruminococcaceae bacterium]|nr:hypothetical protein [Oscillospiraceae bacterium]